MRPLAATEIRGSWATLLSVWDEGERLDLGRLAAQIDALIAFDVDGIYMNGTAGEFHAQTEAEFVAIAELLAERCTAAGTPFQIGVSHMSAQLSLARLRRAVPLAPSALQVVLPDWFPVTDDEAIRFLARMAEEAEGIGLVLYAPPHAKRRLSVDDLALLSTAVPAVVGVKVAGGDDAWYAAMRARLSHLAVFVPGHHLASGVLRGAHGAYSNVACLHPGAARDWWRRIGRDAEGALELEARLRAFLARYIEPFIVEHGHAPFACDRLLAQVGGWADVGQRVRWPYRSIPMREVPRLRAALDELVPEFGRDAPAPS
jgi:dihydrodipicolinate synthase/N-acetylneuraminate lyase